MDPRGPGPSPGGLIAYFTRHPTIANLLMAVMCIVGLVAATQIRAQYFPDTVVDEIDVVIVWDGAGPEDVDRAIVQAVEPVLLTVDGAAAVTARSVEGRALIEVEFEPDHDIARALEDVTEAVEGITTLPEDAETPEISRSVWRDQVTDVVISGPVGVDQLGRFADEFVQRLFADGITRSTIRGLAAPGITVEVPTVALMRHDLTVEEIAAAIAAEVDANPAGQVGSGGARVRTGEGARDADALRSVVLRSAPDGTALKLGQIATVRAEPANRGRAAYVGENPAVTLRIDRSAEGDAIRMQATIARVAAAMQAELPPGVTIELIRTRAEQITQRLSLLFEDTASGLLIVLGILFLSLNLRMAFWVAAGIPIAVLAAVAVMYVAGLTINMISLFGLILILGVLVDDSIVVSEHADWRMRTLGEHPVVAAERAARRMSLPILASTLTTVIAFLGLTTIGGRFGDLIWDIPFTVIAVLIASLVECFLILPNHMAHALAKSPAAAWYDLPSRLVNRGFDWLNHNAMRPLARLVLRARYVVLAGAVYLLATQVAAFLRGDVQFRFFNAPEQSSITGNFAMLAGADRADTLAMMRELQRAVEAVAARLAAEHGTDPVEYLLAEVGGNVGRGLPSADTKDADLLGSVAIELIEPDLRPYSSSAFVAQLQDEVRAHPLLEELSFRGGRFGPGGDALSVELSGAEAEVLKAAAEAVKAALAPYPEVSALEDTLAYDKEELVLSLTPQGEALGFTTETLGRALRNRLNGVEAASFPAGTRTATIRVELPEAERGDDFLDTMLMRAGPGVYVPLADLVSVEVRAGFSTIRREDGQRLVTVTGDLSGDDPARANAILDELTGTILPRIEAAHGVRAVQTGLSADEARFLGDAWIGLLLSLAGIYLVLAWVFASWLRPLVVMSIIPFALTGAIWGHGLWEVPLSMFSVVGMIGMIGIVVNDSIVLVSTVDEYSAERGLAPATVAAVGDRLRPVVLTTATTVLGLAPLLVETSQQAQFLKPTVITLFYGLGCGALIVLILVPAVMMILDDFARPLRALRRSLARRSPHRRVVGLAAVVAAAAFAALFGSVALTGAPPGWVLALRPSLAGAPAGAAALGLFLAVTVAASAAALVAAGIGARFRARGSR
jgi:multidrug efflux pump subunit AcrB